MKKQLTAGYIFNFSGHGAFSPEGKLCEQMSQSEIEAHNKASADAEWQQMSETGKATLYLSQKDIPADPTGKALELKAWIVGTWDGSHYCRVYYRRTSFHNFAGQDGRTDVWFMRDGKRWHGVNIGDNDIVHCGRIK